MKMKDETTADIIKRQILKPYLCETFIMMLGTLFLLYVLVSAVSDVITTEPNFADYSYLQTLFLALEAIACLAMLLLGLSQRLARFWVLFFGIILDWRSFQTKQYAVNSSRPLELISRHPITKKIVYLSLTRFPPGRDRFFWLFYDKCCRPSNLFYLDERIIDERAFVRLNDAVKQGKKSYTITYLSHSKIILGISPGDGSVGGNAPE